MTKLKNAGIYVLCNRDNGKCYVGKDSNLGSRAKIHLALKDKSCPTIHNAIKKLGADAFDVELIRYPNISREALCEVEKWKIVQLKSHRSKGGYNLTHGGDGLDPDIASKTSRKRVAEGTHNFIGGELQKKRVVDGTHPFLNGEIQRKAQRKRVAEGTHHLLDREQARKNALKRIADGTHHFLKVDYNRTRLENGTHPFLDKSIQPRAIYSRRIAHKNRRREFYRIYAALLTTKSVCEEWIYRKRIREGFFDIDIPDTSNAEQQEIGFD